MKPMVKKQLQSLVDRLDDPNQLDECIDEMRRIHDEQWGSGSGSAGSCCIVGGVDANLFNEAKLMNQALASLEQRDAAGAASILKEALANAD